MPIVEIKTVNRADTNTAFFNDSNNAVSMQTKATIGYVLVEQTPTYLKVATPDGKIVNERTVSANGLTQTNTTTFASLEDYSRVETAIGIDLDDEYRQYIEEHSLDHSENQYTQTGINAPFTCTTTYSYTANTSTLFPLFDYFVNALEASEKLISLVNTGTQVVAVHEYENSEDFTANHWADFPYVHSLRTGEVTRTISYASL